MSNSINVDVEVDIDDIIYNMSSYDKLDLAKECDLEEIRKSLL